MQIAGNISKYIAQKAAKGFLMSKKYVSQDQYKVTPIVFSNDSALKTALMLEKSTYTRKQAVGLIYNFNV